MAPSSNAYLFPCDGSCPRALVEWEPREAKWSPMCICKWHGSDDQRYCHWSGDRHDEHVDSTGDVDVDMHGSMIKRGDGGQRDGSWAWVVIAWIDPLACVQCEMLNPYVWDGFTRGHVVVELCLRDLHGNPPEDAVVPHAVWEDSTVCVLASLLRKHAHDAIETRWRDSTHHLPTGPTNKKSIFSY